MAGRAAIFVTYPFHARGSLMNASAPPQLSGMSFSFCTQIRFPSPPSTQQCQRIDCETRVSRSMF
jgi:hypothetical protein